MKLENHYFCRYEQLTLVLQCHVTTLIATKMDSLKHNKLEFLSLLIIQNGQLRVHEAHCYLLERNKKCVIKNGP